MPAVLVELRAGEGGDDAKALVCEFATMYQKAGARRGL